MSDDLLTIKEIARQLDLPESNIRYYRDKFEEFIPFVGEGRKRRYKSEALEVFRFIVSELRENKSTDEIGKELLARFSRSMQLDSSEEKEGQLYPVFARESETQEFTRVLNQQALALESLAHTLHAQNQREDKLHAVYQDHETMKKALILLWKIHKKNLKEEKSLNLAKRLKNLEIQVNCLQTEVNALRKEQEEYKAKQNREKT